METTIPAELLDLKSRLDQWRATRQHIHEPMPAELRQAVVEISKRSPALVRRILKIDPWRLNRLTANQSPPATTPKNQHTAFFKLPNDAVLPQTSAAPSTSGCRLQLERPDGSRLTLTLPALDPMSTRQICTDFLRDPQP